MQNVNFFSFTNFYCCHYVKSVGIMSLCRRTASSKGDGACLNTSGFLFFFFYKLISQKIQYNHSLGQVKEWVKKIHSIYTLFQLNAVTTEALTFNITIEVLSYKRMANLIRTISTFFRIQISSLNETIYKNNT